MGFSVSKYLLLLIAFVVVSAACSSDGAPAPSPRPATVPANATPAAVASPTPTATTPTVNSIVLTISVAELAADLPGYDRDDWRHWTDADGDCQNARHETLIEESRIPVAFKDERRCQVASGEWVGPYTGTLVTEASDLDIDHMVPLANAHRSGGWQWPEDRKERYANYLDYPGHLVATTRRANRTKSDKGPEAWRPDDRAYWCQYALDWIEVKREWELTATPDEAEALREMVESCEMQVFIQAKRVEPASPGVNVSAPTLAPTIIASPTMTPVPAATATATSTATPAPAMTPFPTVAATPSPIAAPPPTPTMAPTATEFEDRNCSDFDTWQEAQDFFLSEGGPEEDPHRLDRNSDRGGVRVAARRSVDSQSQKMRRKDVPDEGYRNQAIFGSGGRRTRLLHSKGRDG